MDIRKDVPPEGKYILDALPEDTAPSGKMHDYKYRALYEPMPDWGWHLKDIRSEHLKEVSEVLRWHVVRSSTFALVPAFTALDAIRDQLWQDYAALETGAKIDPELSRYTQEEVSNEAKQVFASLALEYRKLPDEVFRSLLSEIGIQFIENTLEVPQLKSMRVAIMALLESVVIDAWTSFEIISADLWVKMLDNERCGIANRVDTSKALRDAKNGTSSEFDLRTHPGSFWFDTRRAVFQNIWDIRKLYDAALESKATQLFKEVENGYIFALSAFRNVLVHKRGIADKKFVSDVADFPEFKHYRRGDQVFLDGELAAKMRRASIFLLRKLMVEADSVLP